MPLGWRTLPVPCSTAGEPLLVPPVCRPRCSSGCHECLERMRWNRRHKSSSQRLRSLTASCVLLGPAAQPE